MNTFFSFRLRFSRRGLLEILRALLSLPAAALFLALPVSVARGAPLGQNVLSLGTASGASGTEVTVALNLANQDAVGGIQLDVRFDPTVVSFTGTVITSRTAGMSIGSSTPAAGRLRIVMYFGGGGNVAAGTGAVADLTFLLVGTGGSALTPEAMELSDPTGQTLSVTATGGEITVIGGAEALSIGTGSGASGAEVTVPLGLQNAQAIGALQLDILFDPAVVSFTSAAITSRATGMSIPTSTTSPGRLRVVMYFGGGGSIPAGDGAVANLTFQTIGAAGTGCDLTPDAAALSDPNAQALPVTATAGHITVTGGGDPTGACCASAGTCTLVTQPGCAAGIWQGLNTACTPNPCPPAPAADTLSVGSGSGASGTEVTVPLGLGNTQPAKGLQLDIRFTASVVSWVRGTAAPRVGGMTFSAQPQGTDGVRIVMYYADATTVAPGTGAIANLVFRLNGVGGSSSSLALSGVVVANPDGQPIVVTNREGRLDVTGGPGDPTGACCAPSGACTLVTQVACTAGTWRGANTACVPNPCPAPSPADTLAVGGGSGPSGGQITIPIGLANHVAVRGIQADIRIDPAVLRFESGAAAPRVGSMVFAASSPTQDRVRILLYYDNTSTLAPGRGAVANLVFRITGAGGSRSSLMAADIHIADVNNQEIPTVGSAGEVSVIGGGAPPDLQLAVLKNPGRMRTLQIFLSSDVGLDAMPTVGLSGGVAVPLTQLPGVNIFQGSVSVDDGTASVTVQATGSHDGATGTVQSSVTF